MRAGVPAPPPNFGASLGAKQDGTLTALTADVYLDNGCFPFELPGSWRYMLGRFYQAPNDRAGGYDVLTFKPSAVAISRDPGAAQRGLCADTLMDSWPPS